ncbi:hypothetical protein LUZ60_003320 [Juncus effusus]|nr:hypothetical protein LUZ60_003320 [Juncus effusus]
MVIISPKTLISSSKTPILKSNCTSTINGIAEEESEQNCTDIESQEPGCEIALFQGQICNIPYDLYDLPDLNEILSLETWNYYLTENERLFLTSFLPDMEMDEFHIAIKELFNGCSIFFGNPIEKLFRGLKSGFYSPQVSQMREFLLFLQKRAYYHNLKLYHDSMIEKFADMARFWIDCEKTVTVEERIQILNRKYFEKEKPRILVDLNEFPAEELEVQNLIPNPPFIRKLTDSHDLVSNLNKKAKGVVKMNQNETFLFQKEFILKTPNGVLKLKPKNNSVGKIIPLDYLQSGPSKNFISRVGPSWDPHEINAVSPCIYRNLNQNSESSSHSVISSIDNNNNCRERNSNFEPYEKNLLQNFGQPENNSVHENNSSLENQDLFLDKLSDRKIPLTYKRRKTHRKLDLMDPNNL